MENQQMVINRALNKHIPLTKELLEMEVSYCGVISAGFSSEAFNYSEKGIDFNRFRALEHASIYKLGVSVESVVEKVSRLKKMTKVML